MAPEVLEFRRNQLRAPQQEEEGGFNLTNLLGVGAAAGAIAGGTFGLVRALRKDPAKTATGSLPKGYGASVENFVSEEGRSSKENLAKQGFVQVSTDVSPSSTPPAPQTPTQAPAAPKQTEVDFVSKYIDEIGEDLELKRQARAVQKVEAEEKAQAKNILAELRREEETSQFTPRSFLESKGSLEKLPEAVSEQPQNVASDLTSLQDNLLAQAQDQLANAVESGEDQFTGRQIQAIQRDTDTVKTSSSAPVTLPVIFSGEKQISPQMLEAESLTGPQRGSTQSPSILSQVKERRAEGRDERAEAYRLLRESLADTADDINVEELDPSRVGSLAKELLQKAKQKTQKAPPAPITQSYKDALFDADPSRPYTIGLLKPEVIARNLGDTNVFPEELQQKLVAAIKPSTRKTEGMGALELDPSVQLEATNHVIKNLLAEDNADSVKDYLLGGGEYINPRTKGFGYTGTGSEKTQVFTITNDQGKSEVKVSRPTSAARRTRSDLEPLFFDPDTGTLVSKSEMGATQSVEGDVGSGIGQEIGQAVAFLPRKDVAPFVSLPGVSASGPEGVNKNQGAGYAIGGVKEFGTGKESSVDLSVPTLELFNAANDAVEGGAVKISKNGKFYVPVNSLMREANPALNYDYDVSEYGTLYKNLLTGEDFTSAHEATNTYNKLAKAVNNRLIAPAEVNVAKIENTENMRLQISSPTKESVFIDLNPDLVLDQVTRRTPSGETVTSNVTLSQALRNVLLNPVLTDNAGNVVRDPKSGAPLRGPSLIQERRILNDDGTPGALVYKQSRYKVPEDFVYIDQKTQEVKPKMMGLKDNAFPLAGPDEEGRKNNYLFLEGVNSALEKLTGKRVKVIDDALKIGSSPNFHFYGGSSKNPVLREALTVANTLVQTSETSRVRMRNAEEGLGERYGLGARVSGPAQRTIPLAGLGGREVVLPGQQVSQKRFTDPATGEVTIKSVFKPGSEIIETISPELAGGQRLSAALLDYRQRSGRPMQKQDVLNFASAIAQQEGADVNELLRVAASVSKGRVQQANTGKLMTQGRTALSAMDRLSPNEEIAQTVAEYDFNETIGSDIEDLIASRQPKEMDAELAARQAQRASVEPPGAYGFKPNDQDISNAMNQLMARAGRRAGKRRNR